MSMMVTKFFLGLQGHQSPRGIFISQSQYAIELLKKHGLDECVSMSTPMATERLDADLQGTPTDKTTYRRIIRGLIYLTTIDQDIAFATFVCARYQARPTVKHLKEVRISHKSQENSQKRASTDTRIRRVQSRSPKAQSLSQFSSTRANLAISERSL
ncbi:hypothetical protein Tco_0650683 [Tanacetum coccineum]